MDFGKGQQVQLYLFIFFPVEPIWMKFLNLKQTLMLKQYIRPMTTQSDSCDQ